ncbi:MAG: Gfo/Idh/MocA family oxidoreductase, partial [Butyrivibrio sp.]|nr:Gfo/Idh/MocA family oxidoreductase [Butyrivibrio sp.]
MCRSEEKTQLIRHNTGVEATTDLKTAISFAPDFVVVAVDRGHVAEVAEEWVLRGFPVITETPVGASFESLKRLWNLSIKKSAKIVCCEQYYRQPMLSKGLSLV